MSRHELSSYPVTGRGQRVIDAAQRSDSVQLSDGDQLLAVVLLEVKCAVDILVKQRL